MKSLADVILDLPDTSVYLRELLDRWRGATTDRFNVVTAIVDLVVNDELTDRLEGSADADAFLLDAIDLVLDRALEDVLLTV